MNAAELDTASFVAVERMKETEAALLNARIGRYQVGVRQPRPVLLGVLGTPGPSPPSPPGSDTMKRGEPVPAPALQKRESFTQYGRTVYPITVDATFSVGKEIGNGPVTNIVSTDLNGNGKRDVVLSAVPQMSTTETLVVIVDFLSPTETYASLAVNTNGTNNGHDLVTVDLDGDGFDDVVSTAPWRNAEGITSGGASAVFGQVGDAEDMSLVIVPPYSPQSGIYEDFGESAARCSFDGHATLVVGAPGSPETRVGPSGSLAAVYWPGTADLQHLAHPWSDNYVSFGRHLACGTDASTVLVTTAVPVTEAAREDYNRSSLLIYPDATQLQLDPGTEPAFAVHQRYLVHEYGYDLGNQLLVVDLNGDGQVDIFTTYMLGGKAYAVLIMGPFTNGTIAPKVVRLYRADTLRVHALVGPPVVLRDEAGRPAMLLLKGRNDGLASSWPAWEYLGFELPLEFNGLKIVAKDVPPSNGTTGDPTIATTADEGSDNVASTTIAGDTTATTIPSPSSSNTGEQGSESTLAPGGSAALANGKGDGSSAVMLAVGIAAAIGVCGLVILAVGLLMVRRRRRGQHGSSTKTVGGDVAMTQRRGESGRNVRRTTSRSLHRQRSEQSTGRYEHMPRRPGAAGPTGPSAGATQPMGYVSGDLGGGNSYAMGTLGSPPTAARAPTPTVTPTRPSYAVGNPSF